jgi:uncharacterized protein (TIGR00369 family)
MKIQGEIAFTITDQSPECVQAEMPVRPGILNPYGVVNAGALLWFADACAALLAYGNDETAAGGLGVVVGLSVKAMVVGNQMDGALKASSKFVARGDELSIVCTTITGANNRIIADVTTSYIAANKQ